MSNKQDHNTVRTNGAGCDGKLANLKELEAALNNNSLIEDCKILARESAEGSLDLVVYAVPTLPYTRDRLQAEVASSFSQFNPCRHFVVPVAALPLTATGEVDEPALRQLPVLDEELVQRWEAQIRELPGVAQAAVVVREPETPQHSLHLSDLIPGWKPAGLQDGGIIAAASESAAPAKESRPRPAAFADGGPLTVPADAPRTFTEAILRTAKQCPSRGIVHIRANGEEYFQSYPMLLEQARRILAGLHARGLKQGDRVILQCELLSDHFAAFWACVLGGITPVNVAVSASYAERTAIVNKLYNVWKLLKHPTVIASSHLVKPLADLERFFPGEKFNVLSVEELKKNPPTEEIYESKPDDLVFFQLTSGSTGVPKCIQESHRSIIAHIHGSAQFNGYTPHDVILNWLPVDHVVPTLTCNLKDVYLGCQEVQVATNFVLSEPLHWLELMEAYKVTHSWAPNFGFKLVADRLATVEDCQFDLSSVKFLMNAGEQVTLPVVADFLRRTAAFGITPKVMQPAFGMAEVCTCMTYANDFTIETGVRRFLKSTLNGLMEPSDAEDSTTIAFVDLGPPMPGVQIRIADSQNRVVPEGKIGRFQIRGDVTTRGYLYNDEANKEAFVGEGWFNSGDLGYIWNGRLTLTGREKEMIIVRGANFYCYEIEDVVNGLPGVEPTFTAAVAVSDPSTGTEGLAIFFVPQHHNLAESARLIEQVRSSVASNLGISPSIVVPMRKADFCKTTSGKIQRNQMKKSLMAGEYDATLKAADLALGNGNTLPAWFYRKTWRRKAVTPRPLSHEDGAVLLFLDAKGLGKQLAAKLASLQQSCIQVEAGNDFAQLDSQGYRINPADPAHYRQLWGSITESGMRVGQVLHLGSYRPLEKNWLQEESVKQSSEHGIFSLLSLVQLLSGICGEASRPSRLLAISSHSQKVTEGEALDSTRSALAGLLATVPQELPWLACSHVDLQANDLEKDAENLLAEVQGRSRDRQAAWRDGKRFVVQLQAVDFQHKPLPPAFRQGGLYVLSGGLGGVGQGIARHLLKKHQARLLILGRTPLPEKKLWAEHLEKKDTAAARIQAFQELEHLGQVHYEAVDVCDLGAVRSAVEKAKKRWQCQVEGVLHLAGLYQERQLGEESRQTFARVLAPKVQGALVLHQLVKDQPGALFVSFSSVYGFFGGFSIGAYSAANAFLDSFADYQRSCGLRSHCLAWSIWDETGMSRGFAMQQLSRSRGYYSLLHDQAIHSFQAALSQDCAHLLIGLDGSKPAIRRHLDSSPLALQELSACVVSQNGEPLARHLGELGVADRFSTLSHCGFRRLDHVPLTADGQIDRVQLLVQTQEISLHKQAPETEVEKALAEIWAEVLGVGRVGRQDNFFDLGGHSLSAVQITFKIRQLFNLEFPLKNFLEAPVLGVQAQQLETKLLQQVDASELEEFMDEMGPTA